MWLALQWPSDFSETHQAPQVGASSSTSVLHVIMLYTQCQGGTNVLLVAPPPPLSLRVTLHIVTLHRVGYTSPIRACSGQISVVLS